MVYMNGVLEIRRVITIFLTIIAIIIAGLYFYSHNVTTYFRPDDTIYHCKSDGFNYYLFFNGGDEMVMIYSDEYVTSFGKATYSCSGYYWNHLFGDLYFRTKSLLSITNVEEANPATIITNCNTNFYVDGFESTKRKENAESIGVTTKFDILFYNDGILFDGMRFNNTDKIDDVLSENVRLFIDLDLGK